MESMKKLLVVTAGILALGWGATFVNVVNDKPAVIETYTMPSEPEQEAPQTVSKPIEAHTEQRSVKYTPPTPKPLETPDNGAEARLTANRLLANFGYTPEEIACTWAVYDSRYNEVINGLVFTVAKQVKGDPYLNHPECPERPAPIVTQEQNSQSSDSAQ